jgi:hypothetical protein
MTRKLHTRTKIFFENPYVIRVDHEENPNLLFTQPLPKSFSDLRSRAYKLIQGTWGFSRPQIETQQEDNGILTSLFNGRMVIRSYWCFRNDIDALQFRLMVGNNAKQIHLWPSSIWFTIHEVVESNES